MDYYFEKNMKRLEEYLLVYDNYSEVEKLDVACDIKNCFDCILKARYSKKFNKEMIYKIHNIILKLDCFEALVRLDTIMIEQIYNFDYKKILMEDVSNNLVCLARKRLNLFITKGLEYQLSINDEFLAKPFEYNEQVLNKYGKNIIKDTLRLLEWVELCLKEIKVDVNIVDKMYGDFTTEQLAFIYAQLEYHEFVNNSYFENGGTDSYVGEADERIFQEMWKRSNNEKIRFMQIICELGYCNIGMGICAMLVDLYKTMDNVSICLMLREVLRCRKDHIIQYDTEIDVYHYLERSKCIKELRDEDIRNGNKIDIIYNYNIISTNGKRKY